MQLINASALDEFASAVRSVNGQPDLSVQSMRGTFDDRVYTDLATVAGVDEASPVIEGTVAARGPDGTLVPLRIVGVDALRVAAVAGNLMPRLAEGRDRLDLFAPRTLFLNPAATAVWPKGPLTALVDAQRPIVLERAGDVAAQGPPLAVMDIGAAQDLLGQPGRLSRIDLKLVSGLTPELFSQRWPAPTGTLLSQPGDTNLRVSNMSRAYRVNLTVLALVALFTGTFLVYSVLALSVARRSQQLALLAVLGLTRGERLKLVLAESAVLGVVGSALGLLLGSALAALALTWLGGDLGGGYFQVAGGALQWPWDHTTALVFGALGTGAALAGGWWPARSAGALPPAQALKGLGGGTTGQADLPWAALAALAAAGAMSTLPPIAGMALGAYAAIAALLVGGIGLLPWLIRVLNDRLAPALERWLLPLLAVERARHARETAAVAVSGVVAALALSVALTVMVASFRDSVTAWLDTVLPADLYVRIDRQLAPSGHFSPEQVQAVAGLGEVARSTASRIQPVVMDPTRAPVTLIARTFMPGPDAAARASQTLPLVGEPWVPSDPQAIPVYASETFAALFDVAPGDPLPALLGTTGSTPPLVVAGIWRDYARQQGSLALDLADYRRLTGDTEVNELALWLAPGQTAGNTAALQHIIERQLDAAGPQGRPEGIEFASAAELRATSLRIFDRSFAVTYWLQGVAIGIGLFGVAASLSAQVLARRKEFGMLRHLGLTRRQILGVVAGEGAVWTAIGSAAGLALGLVISLILVKVVNPQSFHWTMDMSLPATRLIALCAAVVAVGTLTAWLAARAAAGQDAVLSVKEDW